MGRAKPGSIHAYRMKRVGAAKGRPYLTKAARKRLAFLERKKRVARLSATELLEYRRLSGDAATDWHAIMSGEQRKEEPTRKPTQPPDVPLPKLARAKGGWQILSGTDRFFFRDEAEASRVFRALEKQAQALRRQALKKEESRNADELKYIEKERKEIADERKRLKALDGSLDSRGNSLLVRERALKAEQERLTRESAKLERVVSGTPIRAVASGPRKFAKGGEHV